MRAYFLATFIVVAGSLSSCSSSEEAPTCRIGADCASGICDPNGRCATNAATPTPSATASSPNAPLPVPDAGVDETGSKPVGCVPNRDGIIVRDEVPLMAGLRGTYRAAQNVTCRTAGTEAGGKYTWDLSQDLPGDHLLLLETRTLASQWFEKTFPNAAYAVRLSDTADLLGVFEPTQEALKLRGVVSPQGGLTKTELTYDPPVDTLSFPLTVGKKWSARSTVTGTAQGVWGFYSEDYAYEVDRAGEAKTPFGLFPVSRIKVVLKRQVGLLTTTVRSYIFVSECVGPVVRMVSKDNESSDEFTNCGEVARLAP